MFPRSKKKSSQENIICNGKFEEIYSFTDFMVPNFTPFSIII